MKLRPIEKEELESPQAVEAWMREAGKFLEIEREIRYTPDVLMEDFIEDDGFLITVYNVDTSGAVLDFIDQAFEIRSGKDFILKCPNIFEGAMSLEDIENLDPAEMELI